MKPVLVIGGGLAGVASAFELSRRGREVHLFEAGGELAGETSHANGGMLTPSQSEPWNHPGVLWQLLTSLFSPHAALKARPGAFLANWRWGLSFLRQSSPHSFGRAMAANFLLGVQSAQLTRDWEDEFGLKFSHVRNGTLKVFRNKHEMRLALSHTKMLTPFGLEVEELGRSGLVAKEPALLSQKDELHAGLFYPADSVGNAREFTIALGAQAVSQGVQIHLNETVIAIAADDERVTGICTNVGEYAGEVVLAAGVASPKLAKQVGVKLQMAPVKGYSITLPGLAKQPGAPAIAILDEARHTAVVPIGDDIRLVGTAEIAGFNKSIRAERLANLRKVFRDLLPGLAEQEAVDPLDWAGLRPMTARGIPYIGASGRDGLWLNTGHGHLGWTQAAGSAELLADLLLGDEPHLDPKLFQLT